MDKNEQVEYWAHMLDESEMSDETFIPAQLIWSIGADMKGLVSYVEKDERPAVKMALKKLEAALEAYDQFTSAIEPYAQEEDADFRPVDVNDDLPF